MLGLGKQPVAPRSNMRKVTPSLSRAMQLPQGRTNMPGAGPSPSLQLSPALTHPPTHPQASMPYQPPTPTATTTSRRRAPLHSLASVIRSGAMRSKIFFLGLSWASGSRPYLQSYITKHNVNVLEANRTCGPKGSGRGHLRSR